MKSEKLSRIRFALLGIALVALLCGTLLADSDDPPARVARLNYIQGAVSFEPGGEQDWVRANPNRPLTTGDSLWVDRDSRGEVHIASTAIRIGSQTNITFLNLNDRTVQLQLPQGTVEVHLRRLDSDDAFEVDTPNLALALLRPGDYRIDVDPNGQTTVVAVRDGQGEVTGGGNAYTVGPDQQAAFTGSDSLTYDVTNLGPGDDFDNWCYARDEREERAISARYVSPGVTGYEDLDDYGSWRNTPAYGPVWVPARVPAGWAPYHDGHWAWIEPWGWTWVDDEPWGFAPFHYGRWAYVGGSWGWVPGPVVVRPVYAPALVVFVGSGPNVGWFPLGPREVYVPAYRCSPRYVQYVNVTNTTVNNTYVTNVYNNHINNINVTRIAYVNRSAPGAVTVVNRNTFVNARPVPSAAVRVPPAQLRTAAVMRAAAVAPQRRSILGWPVSASSVARPPVTLAKRQVVVKLDPPAPPLPYARRQRALSSSPGRPLAPSQVQQLRKPEDRQQPFVRFAPPVQVRADMYTSRGQGAPVRGARGPQPAQQINRMPAHPAPHGPEPQRAPRQQPQHP